MTTLVAIPGTLCAPSVFDRLAEELGDEFAVDAVDWMNAPGPWTIDAVAEYVASRIDDKALVAGHSTGGAIAIRLAVLRPDLVAGLLLANTGAHMRGHGDVDKIIDTVATAWRPELPEAVLDRSFASPAPPGFRAELLAYALSVPREAVLQVLRSQRDTDLTPDLPHVTCPATVLHGTLDPVRTPAQAEEIAAGIPDCELVTVHTGHTPVWEAPGDAAAAVRELAARASRLKLLP